VAVTQTRVADMGKTIDALAQAPEQLMYQTIDHAIDTAAGAFTQSVNNIRSCGPAGS